MELQEKAPVTEDADVEVIFLDKDDRRWEEIINDRTPRPKLERAAEAARQEHREGKTKPLDPDKL